MGAALTLLILLAIAQVIVRIASVALRLTGLQDHIARLQSISALTGTGFTTTESESIVNYPIRRRVIVGLMIFGNLGLVSVASTFIIAFTDKAGDTNAILMQAIFIILAIAAIFVIMTSKTLDAVLCRFIRTILRSFTNLEQKQTHMLLDLGDNYSIVEYVFRGREPQPLSNIFPASVKIHVLSIQGSRPRHLDEISLDSIIEPNETFICYASETAHGKLKEFLLINFHESI